VGASPLNMMTENTADDIVYLALPDSHQLVVYDVANSGIHSLTLGGGPDELSFDPTAGILFGAEFSAGLIFLEY